eukprot:5738970-Amphidinium_carterae.1
MELKAQLQASEQKIHKLANQSRKDSASPNPFRREKGTWNLPHAASFSSPVAEGGGQATRAKVVEAASLHLAPLPMPFPVETMSGSGACHTQVAVKQEGQNEGNPDPWA